MSGAQKVIEAARNRLLAYCSLTNENYKMPEHIVKIAKALEAVERGEIKRLIITIPPRHGKSMLCSQYFPAWFLGRNPDKYIITATYGQDLSDDFGRKVRDQLEAQLIQAIFPACEIRKDTRASNRMETSKGGLYFGVGAGGPITGRGAHVLLIDDPVKNREEAESETYRKRLIDWYKSVAFTRLMPNGAIVIIMTRWHVEDLVGFVLEEQKNEDWVKIDLKAIDDDGKALWPDAYSIDELRRIEEALGPYDWSCLYQQNPILRNKVIFKPEDLLPTEGDLGKKDFAYKVISIDPAITEEETKNSCETAISTLGLEWDTNFIHEIETVSGHWGFDEIIRNIKAACLRYNPDMVGIEEVAFSKAFRQHLEKDKAFTWRVLPFKADKDKTRRALAVSRYFELQKVKINDPKTRQQLISFPNGKLKDRVDSIVHGIREMMEYVRENYVKPVDKYKDLNKETKEFFKERDEILQKVKYQNENSELDMYNF